MLLHREWNLIGSERIVRLPASGISIFIDTRLAILIQVVNLLPYFAKFRN